MPYGHLTEEMLRALEQTIRGELVVDVRAGDLYYTRILLELGAKKVMAIDKEPLPRARRGIQTPHHKPLQALKPCIRDAWLFLSWPVNRDIGYLPWLEAARGVVYLGSNVNGSSCGVPALSMHLDYREVPHHIPHRRNTLTLYGGPRKEDRELTHEEVAALSTETIDYEKALRAVESFTERM